MQETLKKAARWYIREYNFSLEEMRQDLKIVLHRRNIAMVQGKIKKVWRAFAAAEIIKAAICLIAGEEYETSFSKIELSHIRALADPKPQTFVCRHCGKEYPASAFKTDTRYSNNLSRYCLSCEKEINAMKSQYAQNRRRSGYIDHSGAIISLTV